METVVPPETIDEIFDNKRITATTQTPNLYDTFTIPDLANKIGVDETTIRNLVFRSRRLAFVRIGHTRVVLWKDWIAFLERERVATLDEVSSEAEKE